MNHVTIITQSQKLFKENWTGLRVHYIESQNIKTDTPYISLSYAPMNTTRKFLTADSSGLCTCGVFRVFIYHTKASKVIAEIDKIVSFLRNRTYKDLRFGVDMIYPIERQKNESFYESFVEFEVCTREG